ncbi:MAG TPA: histidine kinase [Acidobacteriaceae bacterium]
MSTVTSIAEHRQQRFDAPAAAQSHRKGVRRVNPYALIFCMATMLALATAAECRSVTSLPSLIYGAVLWVWWGCIGSLYWRFGAQASFLTTISFATAGTHVAIASSLAALHMLALGSLGFADPHWAEHRSAWNVATSLFGINRFGLEILIYGFVLGVTGVVRSQIVAQREAMRSLQLEKQLSVAHLRALQMQLEPHFLFNALNAITTLVELGRQEQAVEMLSHLNAMLKSTLKRSTPEKIPLSQELELVENYLAIEQARFADRLQIAIKVDPGALDGLVPCFLLQPIVENAIRHGIAQCEQEGRIEATVRRSGARLHLRVHDSGGAKPQLATAHNGHGIGLANTRERLTHFYRDDYAMTAEPGRAGGFEVAIAIPYERAIR